MESVSKVTHKFIKGSEGFIPCRVAQVDLGLDMVDPGLAPDGSKCGYGKVSNLMLVFFMHKTTDLFF